MRHAGFYSSQARIDNQGASGTERQKAGSTSAEVGNSHPTGTTRLLEGAFDLSPYSRTLHQLDSRHQRPLRPNRQSSHQPSGKQIPTRGQSERAKILLPAAVR